MLIWLSTGCFQVFLQRTTKTLNLWMTRYYRLAWLGSAVLLPQAVQLLLSVDLDGKIKSKMLCHTPTLPVCPVCSTTKQAKGSNVIEAVQGW